MVSTDTRSSSRCQKDTLVFSVQENSQRCDQSQQTHPHCPLNIYTHKRTRSSLKRPDQWQNPPFTGWTLMNHYTVIVEALTPPWHFPPFKCLIEALLLRNAVELQWGHQTGSKRASDEQDGTERTFDSCWSSCPRRALAISLEGYQRAPLLFISAECQWRPG